MRILRSIAVDDKRCVQSSFRMIVEAFTGKDPGLEAADSSTGYVEGRGTWQFRMLLAFSNLGLSVIDYELFDTEMFLRDPEEAIRRQVGDELVAAQNIADTDLDAEVNALRSCLASPLIRFENAIPTFDTLIKQNQCERALICAVNLRVLENQPGHIGHSLIVQDIGSESVMVADPAPPGRMDLCIPKDVFIRAWNSPSDSMANFISVGRPKVQSLT